MTKILERDVEMFILSKGLPTGIELIKKDKRTFYEKLFNKPRKEWEYFFLCDYEEVSGQSSKVLIKKGTKIMYAPHGIQAERITVLC